MKGVLFDMDGVLVDSEEFICKAAMQMFAEKGLVVKPEDFLPFVGRGENSYIGGVAEKYGLNIDIKRDKARTYTLYDEIVKGKLKPLPGVKEFITFCLDNNVKIAIATSADKIKMEINLREIGIPVSVFSAKISGSEVEHKKPDPEIFLKAAKKIGLPAEECLVIEDSVSGVKAGNMAGCVCLALTTSFSAEQLKHAKWITKDLSSIPKEIILKLKDNNNELPKNKR